MSISQIVARIRATLTPRSGNLENNTPKELDSSTHVHPFGQVVVVGAKPFRGKPIERLYLVAEADPAKAESIVRTAIGSTTADTVKARWRVRKSLLRAFGLSPGEFKALWE